MGIAVPSLSLIHIFTYELEENPRAFYIVADLDGQVVGYAGLWWIEDEGHITNVAVKPGYRNRRIGEGIISVMIDLTSKEGIKHHTLEVLSLIHI